MTFCSTTVTAIGLPFTKIDVCNAISVHKCKSPNLTVGLPFVRTLKEPVINAA